MITNMMSITGSSRSVSSLDRYKSVGSLLVYDKVVYRCDPNHLIGLQLNRSQQMIICESIDNLGKLS